MSFIENLTTKISKFAQVLTKQTMTLVYAKEEFPKEVSKSIFLAGPTPRDSIVKSWRPEALKILQDLNYTGHVFIPEERDGELKGDYTDQIEWELSALNRADTILFWIPRNKDTMPGLTTNVEFGSFANSGRAVLSYPEEATSIRYLQYLADLYKVPSFKSLPQSLEYIVTKHGEGAIRTGGETEVPLSLWNTKSFQSWLTSQKAVGNRLDGAKLLWTFRLGPNKDKIFYWALHVNVYVAAEKRSKYNEIVIARTDISTIALFYKPILPYRETSIKEVKVLLVKEFRSPARTKDSYVLELPGGSAKDDSKETLKVAIEELHEETSFKIDASRLKEIGTRQLAATMSTHVSTLFAGEITKEEFANLTKIYHSGKTFGVAEDTEMTYVVVKSVEEIITEGLLDWSHLGMLLTAIISQ